MRGKGGLEGTSSPYLQCSYMSRPSILGLISWSELRGTEMKGGRVQVK